MDGSSHVERILQKFSPVSVSQTMPGVPGNQAALVVVIVTR